VYSGFDFAKSAFAYVFADHVVTDAPALARWLLPLVRYIGLMTSRRSRAFSGVLFGVARGMCPCARLLLGRSL